jgi:hypothetical protein
VLAAGRARARRASRRPGRGGRAPARPSPGRPRRIGRRSRRHEVRLDVRVGAHASAPRDRGSRPAHDTGARA